MKFWQLYCVVNLAGRGTSSSKILFPVPSSPQVIGGFNVEFAITQLS